MYWCNIMHLYRIPVRINSACLYISRTHAHGVWLNDNVYEYVNNNIKCLIFIITI